MISYFEDHLEDIIKCDPTKLKDLHNKMLIAISYDPTNLVHQEGFDKFKKTMQNYYAAFFQQKINEQGEQISIGRWLTRSIKMDVCPYCNHNYTITVNDRKKKIVVKPDFDHFYSKSIHPILALSYFNLVPICSTCNKLKGEKEVTQNPYDNSHPLPKFKLYGKDKSGNLVLFGLGDAFDEIEIFPEAEYSKLNLKTCNIEKLGLKQIYDQHIDYVTEIVDNIQQYNIGSYSAIIESFQGLGKTESEIDRIIWGYYKGQNHKRPLSKLTSDILEQIGIIDY